MSLPLPVTDHRRLEEALELGDEAALEVYADLPPDRRAGAAGLALQHGRPRLAADWAEHEPLTRAAALLRLGRAAQALEGLHTEPDTARPALLQARAQWQLKQGQLEQRHLTTTNSLDAASLDAAQHARTLARREGDAAALVAAATLIGEQLLSQPYAALRALAEGLKVTEMAAQPSDAHLLAVLAHAQLRLGGPKGQRTAAKALERSLPRSPARVMALLALHRLEEAGAEASAGQLAEVWLRPFRTATSTAAEP
ncbi:hypothetical protein [Deinococcus koreensis]|uniref:Uncharacterized protein n=1 Tax=Deinococcus koreensis TaxID=2054903 RepID=A0A2K3V0N5_9DEIO|nr:hypothetical protein [Deinococcus koreensis]PNY82341.1 hypothetical protein CVO96_14105 [Deinococcus koreensis]